MTRPNRYINYSAWQFNKELFNQPTQKQIDFYNNLCDKYNIKHKYYKTKKQYSKAISDILNKYNSAR